jgi:hypothetical protein
MDLQPRVDRSLTPNPERLGGLNGQRVDVKMSPLEGRCVRGKGESLEHPLHLVWVCKDPGTRLSEGSRGWRKKRVVYLDLADPWTCSDDACTPRHENRRACGRQEGLMAVDMGWGEIVKEPSRELPMESRKIALASALLKQALGGE